MKNSAYIAFFVSVATILMLLSGFASVGAVGTEVGYEDTTNYVSIKDSTLQSPKFEEMEWEPSSLTLTLDGTQKPLDVKYVEIYVPPNSNSSGYVIVILGTVNIVGFSNGANIDGIYCDKDLTIEGSGTLNVKGQVPSDFDDNGIFGLRALGDFTINGKDGLKINIEIETGTGNFVNVVCGIYSDKNLGIFNCDNIKVYIYDGYGTIDWCIGAENILIDGSDGMNLSVRGCPQGDSYGIRSFAEIMINASKDMNIDLDTHGEVRGISAVDAVDKVSILIVDCDNMKIKLHSSGTHQYYWNAFGIFSDTNYEEGLSEPETAKVKIESCDNMKLDVSSDFGTVAGIVATNFAPCGTEQICSVDVKDCNNVSIRIGSEYGGVGFFAGGSIDTTGTKNISVEFSDKTDRNFGYFATENLVSEKPAGDRLQYGIVTSFVYDDLSIEISYGGEYVPGACQVVLAQHGSMTVSEDNHVPPNLWAVLVIAIVVALAIIVFRKK